MEEKDIIPYLNIALDFMHEEMHDFPKGFLPQHLIQHFENIGEGELSLIYAKSLFDVLVTHKVAEEKDGYYSITKSGVLLSNMGGFKTE